MANVSSSPEPSSQAPLSPFRCSANDPVLHDLITRALRESPWLTVNTAMLRINWREFIARHGDLTALPSTSQAQPLDQLQTMGETYELGLFAPGQIESQIPSDSTDYLNGLVIMREARDLAPHQALWLESYRDLAERLLYEWEEALKLKTPPSRSQHMKSRIIPSLKEDLRAATSSQFGSLKRVLYPLATRLRLGSALPGELESLTRVSAKRSGDKGGFLPVMQSYAQGVQALHQAWTHLRATQRSSQGASHPHGHPPAPFAHASFRHLVSQNRAFAAHVYQKSIYGCDLGGTPKRAEGFTRIDKTYCLVDREGRVTKKLSFAWAMVADRVLYQMCQSLRDFCTYFYSYTPSADTHARRVLDQIIRLEHAIPRTRPSDFTDDETPDNDTIPITEDFLWSIDHLIERLLEHSPLLVMLATGMLCTYEIPSSDAWGFALGPQLMATILAERGVGGALPYQHIRPQGSAPLPLDPTTSDDIRTEGATTCQPP